MNERKRSEAIDKWNAAHMTPATPKPRAGEHTKGPWRVSADVHSVERIWGPDEMDVACCDGDGSRSLDTRKSNARRIVACVNACEGISDELLQTAYLRLQGKINQLEAEGGLLRERERELVEVMRALTQVGTIDGNVVVGPRGWELVQAALKKVKS